MFHRIERLSTFALLVNLSLLGLLIVGFNGLGWLSGLVEYGRFDLYRSSIPVYPISSLLLILYLNRVAQQALSDFRPALQISGEEYRHLAHQLVTLPRRGVWITLLFSLAFTAVYLSNTAYIFTLIEQAPFIALLECLFYAFAFSLLGLFFFHAGWQLWVVNQIHARLDQIDLFNRTPLYAFSRLSSRTGISLLLMNYFGIVTDPATFSNVALVNITIIAFVLAILSFLLPLRGIYRQIFREKQRLVRQINQQLGAMIQARFAPSHESSGKLNQSEAQLLSNLAATREMLEAIPTLPWEPRTLIGFLTAVLLPFLTRLLVSLIAALLI